MKVRVLRSARITIMEGLRFYEDQEAGLGLYFLDSVMSDIRSLKVYAGIHPISYDTYQRMICDKFPFSIFYRIENSEINVYAVLDDRRDPQWISRRLN